MRVKLSRFSLAIFIATLAIEFHFSLISAVHAQSDSDLTFNAVSIFPTKVGGCRDRITGYCPNGSSYITAPSRFQQDGRYRSCGSFENFLRDAFNIGIGSKVKLWEMPAWMSKDLYDIDAKGPDVGVEQLRLMLRDLLERRFRLKFHFETRMIDVYVLQVAEGGHKLQPAKDDNGAPLKELLAMPSVCSENLEFGAMRTSVNKDGSDLLETRAVDLNKFADLLVNATDCTVVNKTGIEGLFDIKLRFSPWYPGAHVSVSCPPSGNPPAPEPSSPSIFNALEELGLKLQTANVPLELLVIDDAGNPECTDSSGVIPCQ
jgi:uncharacterized protein (TIGR03435 family)